MDFNFIEPKPDFFRPCFNLEFFTEFKLGKIFTKRGNKMNEFGDLNRIMTQKRNHPVFKNINKFIRVNDVKYLITV